MNIIAILEAIISSVPEAVGLWHRIAPLIDVKADVPQSALDEITALAPAVTDTVEAAHNAIEALLNAHKN